MVRLFAMHDDLTMPYRNSIFAMTTFNLGGRVWTLPHVDMENAAWGLCGISTFGRYNSQRSGHLVLHTAKLVVEFPTKTNALIMSAACAHSNIPIAEDEERWSITQYTAGGLFRYLHSNGRTRDMWQKEDPAGFQAYEASHATRWQEAIERFSTIDSLIDDIREVFGL